MRFFLFHCGYFLFPHFSSSPSFLLPRRAPPHLQFFPYSLLTFSLLFFTQCLSSPYQCSGGCLGNEDQCCFKHEMVRGPRRCGINKSHYLSSLMMQPPHLPPPSLCTHHPLSQPISTRYPILDGRRLWIIESQGQCALPPITQWKMTPSQVCVFARRCVGTEWVESLT